MISIFVRKRNAHLITDEAFSQALVDFRAEVIDAVAFKFASVVDSLVSASYPLIAKHSLNATDALILRSALDTVTLLRPADNDIWTTSDHRLLQATQAEGLTTFNPETDSQTQLDALISGT